jgi:hypothetical protein
LKESDLYKPVADWLYKLLKQRYKRMEVRVFDTHKMRLSRLIGNLGLQEFFPQFNAWDIKVDVTGLVKDDKSGCLVFVECKINRPTLRDIVQLLGYSLVVDPILAILLSPQSPTDPVLTLLKDYGRHDILEYGAAKRRLRIGCWSLSRNELVPASLLPRGRLF